AGALHLCGQGPAVGAAGVTMTGVALNICDVSSGYGGAIVVRNVTLDVAAGQIFALMGKNGMGKTTLLKTALGLLAARTGRIEIFGDDVTGLPAYLVALRGV